MYFNAHKSAMIFISALLIDSCECLLSFNYGIKICVINVIPTYRQAGARNKLLISLFKETDYS
jgi:hypothetical protein